MSHSNFSPQLIFLSDTDKKKIHEAVLELLERTGMRVYHSQALTILKDAGCPVSDENQVTIPNRLVQRALETVPNSIPIYNREGDLAMDLGGRRSYFGTGSDLMYWVSSDGMKRHQCRLEDVGRAARLCDALPNIDFIMSFAHPQEIEPSRSYLESFRMMVENSLKPIVNTAEGRTDLAEMWEIAKILRGSEQALRDKPYWIQYSEPISPLKHPFDSVNKLLFCAETGMPVIYSPAPIAGSTAPMTLAGHVVQGLAECFFGMVLHQLAAPGAPFIMGMGAAVLDMTTAQCSYNAPEYLMAYLAMVEMSHFYDIPNWGYAGTSDAQIPDGQATLEAGLLCFLSALAGSNLNHDIGYLDFGLCGSLEIVVIMDEVIDQIRRLQQGIVVDDEQIALDTIAEGSRQGQFLTLPHTLKHVRSTQWRPQLLSRKSHKDWEKEGATSLLDRARSKLEHLLDNHAPSPLSSGQLEAIRERVARFS